MTISSQLLKLIVFEVYIDFYDFDDILIYDFMIYDFLAIIAMSDNSRVPFA